MIRKARGLLADLAYILAYGFFVVLAYSIRAYQGVRLTMVGIENIPRTGGAVYAINHTGYMDPMYAGFGPLRARRAIRYMAKDELWSTRVTRSMVTLTRTIPVDREAGSASYQAAVDALRDGAFVGVFPEATISRSFELKEFKSGLARMAIEAGVPIIPAVLWGSQRIATKGKPKNLHRSRTPVRLHVGKPISPGQTPEELMAEVRESMQALLDEAQTQYGDHPAGEWWVPKRLGGGAPTLEEATQLDNEEIAARRARRERNPGA
ncbi:1-acyl-sn-glycerol-3-phosphate acyltransferase [Hoyosella sp. YIM 151337]|uniref:lysophospholipid acyltransferase family protein n=1 Tax=Hoyosella sp. YIM 151337 TaxID=2992742 RepID=UPI002236258A|nr:lysophospholipid acyltransferase family protein [Hoyosella sp. YIM 151337]MCW4354633.1 1-acyl-sn-glycerol-3-phosphate acyltransferase [Hoyosella sp. YIM 151337]